MFEKFEMPLNCGKSDLKSNFIVGGNNANDGQFPFMVSLEYYRSGQWKHFCGGSIIHKRWALTATHFIEMYASIS